MPRYVALVKETREYRAHFFLDHGQDVERLSDEDVLRRLPDDWDDAPCHSKTIVEDVREVK